MGTVFALIPRTMRTAAGVVLVGAVLGFAFSAAVSAFVTDQGWFSTSGESRTAHDYMISLLERDTQRLSQQRPQQDVVSQALAEQAAQASREQAKPLSLTYLGGGTQGNLSVQIYAVEVQTNDGSDQVFSLALTLLGSTVVMTK